MQFPFTYAGIVESNKDPLKLGRLKVRVPHVFGISTDSAGYVGLNDLPWALPAGLPAGATKKSGGLSHLPEVGDKVWVRFLDGEPEKPIWEWGMQTINDAEVLKLHRYGEGIPVGSPDRIIWTRYNHAIEINEGSVILTTSQGYRLVTTDAADNASQDGNIMLSTQKGNFIKLDDVDDTLKVTVLEDVYYTIGSGFLATSDSFSWITLTQDFEIQSGRRFNLTCTDDIELKTASSMNIDALDSINMVCLNDFILGFNTLKLGLAAIEPAVLGRSLVTLLEALLVWADTHVHISSIPGEPTSTPTITATSVALPTPEQCLSTTVLVQN